MTTAERCLADLRANPETGRELKCADLKTATVYVLWKQTKPEAAATMWCRSIGRTVVEFWAGGVFTTLLLFRQPDDTLKDDSSTQIRVFEYLGKV